MPDRPYSAEENRPRIQSAAIRVCERLHVLTTVRNVCAHHSRLRNRELAVKPELPVTWKANGIGNGRFYLIALIIQILLADIAPDSRWGERLKAIRQF
jgi:abortive infection bacteriophage resistance protein